MKISLIFIVAFLFSVWINAQDFAPIGANWYYGEGFAFSGDIDYLQITSEKDTTIMNQNCRKLLKRHKIGCSNRPNVEFVFSRNDSVFFFDEPFNEFQLLYNFNAKRGDQWAIKVKNEYQEIDTIVIFVDSVSTIQINEIVLKKLFVTYLKKNIYQQNSTIVEKIGDLQYMFNWYPWLEIACDDNFSNGLRCYQDNGFGSYSTGIADSCNYTFVWTNISNSKSGFGFEIYPNPTTGIINVKSNNNSKSYLVLTDITGKKVFQEKFINTIQLDISQLNSGIYFIFINQGSRTTKKRKIVKI